MKTNLLNHSLLGGAACAGAILIMACNAPAQNIFVATYGSQTINEVTPGGSVSTFASSQDYPDGVAFNSAGDLFVANTANNSPSTAGYIAEITPGGTQSTFASGIDPQALAFNSAGDLFEADYDSGNIYEFTPSGTRSTFATGFSFPLSLAFNSSGNLFVGSGYGNGNGVITEVTPGGTQSTFATGLYFPSGLVFNSAGDLFESDKTSGTIYEFTPSGSRSTFASVSLPEGLAFNSAGDLIVSSSGGSSIISVLQITPGGTQSTLATFPGNPVGIAIVPEPSSLMVLAAGIPMLFFRRNWSKKRG